MQLIKKVAALRAAFDEKLTEIKTLQELEILRLEFLGKKGNVLELMSELKNLSLEEKKEAGPLCTELKVYSEEAIKKMREKIITRALFIAQEKQKNFDTTIALTQPLTGHLHPFTHFIQEIENAFISLGYEILDTPEVELDFYNFTALNCPDNHPSRDMHDTFWLQKTDHLLRTHTSAMQVRAMQQKKLPIAAIQPGRVFRHEAVDASHDFMFMQCEGFLIDEGITLAHLFGTVQAFFKALFKKDSLDIRIRPGYFPFVEPGVEIDMRCPFCSRGCSVCKKSTWIEVFPGGMIHPNVLRAGGVDPEKYSGFAFGFGLTRLAMLYYGIDDVRYMYGGKLKFLEQFP